MVKNNLIDNINEGVFVTDTEGRIIFANNALALIHGYDNPDQLLNKYFIEFIEPSARENVAEAFRKSIQSGETVHDIEVPIIKSDGTKATIQIKPSFIYENEKITGTQGIIIDITERKRVEDALKESEAKYHAIFEATSTATLIVEEDTTISMANNRCFQFTGYKPEELIGQKWTRYVAPESLNEMIKNHQLRRTVSGEAPSKYEVKLINKKGEIRDAIIDVGMIPDSKKSIVSITDITKHKQNEKALLDNELSYHGLFDTIEDAIYIQDKDGLFIDVNQGAVKMYGYPHDWFIGKNPLDVAAPGKNDFEKIMAQIHEAYKGKPQILEFWGQRRNGEIFPKEVRLYRGLYFGQEVLITTAIDITKRKRTEEALRKSEERFRIFIENVDDMIYFQGLDGKLTMLNEASTQITGFSTEEFAADPMLWQKIIHPEDVKTAREFFKQHPEGTPYYEIEYRLRNKDGQWRCINSRMTGAKDSSGKYIGYNCIDRDITRQKEAEEALRKSEAKYKSVVDNINDALITDDINGNIVFSNNRFYELFGINKQNSAQIKLEDYVAPEWIPVLRERHNRRVRGESQQTHFEYEGIKQDGQRIWIDVNVVPLYGNDGKITGTQSALRDITERKRAEEALRQSEAQLSNALKIAHLGPWEYDVVNDLFTFNDSFYAIFRTTAEQAGGYTMSSGDYAKRFVHPEDINLVGLEIQKAIETKDPKFNRQLEHRIIYAGGGVGYITVRFFIIKDSKGKTVKTYGVNQDITERKKAEESLKLFRNLVDRSNDAIEVVDPETARFLDINETACLDLGYSREELLSMKVFDIDPTVDESSFIKIGDELKRTGSLLYEGIHLRKDGSTFPVEVNIKYVRLDKDYIITAVRDITEHKQAEEALRLSENKYRSIFENAVEGIFQTTLDGRYISANPALARIYGDTSPEALMERVTDLEHQFYVDPNRRKQFIRLIEENGFVSNFECQVYAKDRSIIWISENARGVRDSKGKLIGYEGTTVDITERKVSEEALRSSQQLIEGIINAIPVRVFWKDKDLIYLGCNSSFSHDAGFAEPKEVIGKDDFQMGWREQAELYRSDDRQVIDSGCAKLNIEEPQTTPEGNTITLLTCKIPLRNSKGEISGVLGTYLDITERKRAEEATQLLAHTVKSIAEIITITDLEDRFTFVNQAFLNKYGYSYDEIIGQHVKILVSPNNPPEICNEILKNSRMDGWKGELLNITKGGKEFPISLQSSKIKNEKGEILGLVGIAQDITERKSAEESLRITEQKHRDIITYAPLGIYQSTREGSFIMVNLKLVEILGYSSIDELMKMNLANDIYYIPEERSRLIEKYEPIGSGSKTEIRWKKKDGTMIWIELSSHAVKNDTGETIYFESFIQDISERKRIEESLLKFKLGIERSDEAIFITDRDGIVQYVNKSFENIYGYSSNDVIGKTPSILKSGLLSADDFKLFWKTLLNKKIVSTEIINKTKDGRLITIDASNNPILDNDENIIGFMGIHSDITERKKTQEELIKAKEKAEQSNKLKDAFIANISHEIRTPLNGILGMTGLIQNSLSKYIRKDEKDYFRAIDQASARMIRTIDMILNFSRIQVGDFPIKQAKIKLASIIENLINSYKAIADTKSIKLSFINKSGNPELKIDEYCVTQAISNLIDNAIKYTVKGKVEVILYADTENKLMLDVKDSGIGISEDYISHIFEPYSQEEIGYNRGYEGVGLGMSLVKKYLDLNGAEISFVSTKDEGTTFTIHFGNCEFNVPEKGIDNTRTKLPQIPDTGNKQKGKIKPLILIVEDDGINQFYLQKILKKEHDTVSAYSADSALEKIKTNNFSLILMDISLRGSMNGLDLTKLLRKSKEYEKIPIIAITGHASPEDKQNCFNAGVNEYIPKPFYEDELIDKIKEFTEKVN